MRLRRSRVVALLAVIICVAFAAAVLRVSEAGPDEEIVRGDLGRAAAVEDGAIAVNGVRVGTQLSRDGDVTDTTPGLFVVVSITGAATGRDKLIRGEARLLAQDDLVYGSYGRSASLGAPPGFADDRDFVFEVDPARIDDLTLEVWRAEFISGYQQRLQVHLGITAANADAWRAAGVEQVVETDVYGRVRPL